MGFHPSMLRTRWELPAFLHWAGLGNTPDVGPALTTTGAIVEGEPIVLASGGAIRTDAYSGAQYRIGNQAAIGVPGSDFVAATCIRIGASQYAMRRKGAASNRGWCITSGGGPANIYGVIYGDASITPGIAWAAAMLLFLKIKSGGDTSIYSSPTVKATIATPAGVIAEDGVISLGANTTGGSAMVGNIAWYCDWAGAGIADLWDAARIAELYALAGVA